MIKNIVGKPVPIHYIDLSFNDRWTIFTIASGPYKGRSVCHIISFKDKTLVDLGYGEPEYKDDGQIVMIDNKDLGFDLEKHLETNRLLEEMNKDLTNSIYILEKYLLFLNKEDKEKLLEIIK